MTKGPRISWGTAAHAHVHDTPTLTIHPATGSRKFRLAPTARPSMRIQPTSLPFSFMCSHFQPSTSTPSPSMIWPAPFASSLSLAPWRGSASIDEDPAHLLAVFLHVQPLP